MPIFIVVDDPRRWPLAISGVEVVSARQYLSDPEYHRLAGTRLFNLCRSYSYQSLGYYVSLLAEARGHRPQPDITTIQDMRSPALARAITEDLDELIQKTLHKIKRSWFEMSIYFGVTIAKRDRELGRRLYGRFRSPLLRVHFSRDRHWKLKAVRSIPASEVPKSHHETVLAAASAYFERRHAPTENARVPRYNMAILHDPAEVLPPSNEKAIRRFIKAGKRADMDIELISRDDYGKLGEFDALFIRTTTAMNHYTYRFARRARAEGLAVIDDPISIARCTNKVYLAELLRLHGIATPPTAVVHRDNLALVAGQLQYPVVLKQPDGSFSRGMQKVDGPDAFLSGASAFLEESDIIIAQAFMPSSYDWRVGVLDNKPLFVCQYFMAPRHWQIVKHGPDGSTDSGRVETLAVEDAPVEVVRAAVRAAKLIGDGLYGVDLKMIGREVYVIEINDNPNIDAHCEDRVLRQGLYDRVILSFIQRIDAIREAANKRGR